MSRVTAGRRARSELTFHVATRNRSGAGAVGDMVSRSDERTAPAGGLGPRRARRGPPGVARRRSAGQRVSGSAGQRVSAATSDSRVGDRDGEPGVAQPAERVERGDRLVERDARAALGRGGERETAIDERDVRRPEHLPRRVRAGHLDVADVGQRCREHPRPVPGGEPRRSAISTCAQRSSITSDLVTNPSRPAAANGHRRGPSSAVVCVRARPAAAAAPDPARVRPPPRPRPRTWAAASGSIAISPSKAGPRSASASTSMSASSLVSDSASAAQAGRRRPRCPSSELASDSAWASASASTTLRGRGGGPVGLS